MVHMIRHFGDQEDGLAPCGLCDVCNPGHSSAQRLREPNASEEVGILRILSTLASDDSQTTGRLYREAFPNNDLNRHTFDHLLDALSRAGLLTLSTESFEKDGREITYRRASLTCAGRVHLDSPKAISVLDLPSKTPKKATGRASRSKVNTKTKAKSPWFFVNRAKRAKKGPA
jgi:DNA topoisomerase-3